MVGSFLRRLANINPLSEREPRYNLYGREILGPASETEGRFALPGYDMGRRDQSTPSVCEKTYIHRKIWMKDVSGASGPRLLFYMELVLIVIIIRKPLIDRSVLLEIVLLIS